MTHTERRIAPIASYLGGAVFAACLVHTGVATADMGAVGEPDGTIIEYSVETEAVANVEGYEAETIDAVESSTLWDEQAVTAQAAIPLVRVHGFADAWATILATCPDGTVVELPCLPDSNESAGEFLVVQGLEELPAGAYVLSVPQGWSLTGAVADTDTESARELDLPEESLPLVLPSEDLATLDLTVETALPETTAEETEPAPAADETDLADLPADQASPAQDGTPAGPDMSGAQESGMPMSGGVSADPLSFLLQVVEDERNSGSDIYITWYDAQSGAVGYARG